MRINIDAKDHHLWIYNKYKEILSFLENSSKLKKKKKKIRRKNLKKKSIKLKYRTKPIIAIIKWIFSSRSRCRKEREEEKEAEGRNCLAICTREEGEGREGSSIVMSIALLYLFKTNNYSQRASFRVHPRAGMCRERVPSWLAGRNVTLQSLLLAVPRPDPRYRSARFDPIISTSFVPFRSNSKPQQPTRETFCENLYDETDNGCLLPPPTTDPLRSPRRRASIRIPHLF